MRDLSVPSNDDCKYQVYYVQSQLAVIIALGCSPYHWLNTDDSQSIAQSLLNLLTKISPIIGKNSNEKIQRTFYSFGLFVWALSILMNFYGVVGH